MRFPGFEGEWETKKLGEVCKMRSGKFVAASEIFDKRIDSLYPCYGGNGLRGYTNSFNHNGIYPLIGRQGALCGNVNLARGKFHATEHAVVVTPDDNTDTIWLFYLLTHLDLNQYATGMAQPGLSVQNLEKVEAVFPKTKSEQVKIGFFLSLIEERISTQNKIIEELNVLKVTISKRIFLGRYRFEDGDVEYPDWNNLKLGDICSIIGGGTPDTRNAEYWNGSIKWFTPTEIKSNFVSRSQRTISKLGLKNSSAKLLPKGTILLTTRATIGEVSMSTVECATNQGFQSLIVKEKVDNIFLFYWIKVNKHEFEKRANGSTFPEIGKSQVEKIEINTPCLEEQKKIADFLSSIDSKIEIENRLLQKLEDQKKFFLQQMFV